MHEHTFSGLWYINQAFAARMHDIILPRIINGAEPIPAHLMATEERQRLAIRAKLTDEDLTTGWLKEEVNWAAKKGGGDVAVIGISGTMSRNGYCGYGNEYITKLIETADKASGIKGIVLNINTPGGTVDSTEMLADTVAECSKPIVGWSPFCASAGYFVGSQCDEFWLEDSVTADVGSIGVLMVYIDQSARLEKEGLKVTIFRADGSEDKAKVNGIETLDEQTIAEIQADLNNCRKAFLGYVKRGRAGKITSDEAFSGKMYKKKDALRLGLVDKVGGLSEAIRSARKMAK